MPGGREREREKGKEKEREGEGGQKKGEKPKVKMGLLRNIAYSVKSVFHNFLPEGEGNKTAMDMHVARDK